MTQFSYGDKNIRGGTAIVAGTTIDIEFSEGAIYASPKGNIAPASVIQAIGQRLAHFIRHNKVDGLPPIDVDIDHPSRDYNFVYKRLCPVNANLGPNGFPSEVRIKVYDVSKRHGPYESHTTPIDCRVLDPIQFDWRH